MAELFGEPDPSPTPGASPTIFDFPGMVGFMKVAGQPVAGPWPPHQQPRPDPEDEAGPVAIVEPTPGAGRGAHRLPADEE
ncbi:hypothetical protein [Pseudonocardia endophytica]|nr:hypothetical protein [Pseudonocardia endophytica]